MRPKFLRPACCTPPSCRRRSVAAMCCRSTRRRRSDLPGFAAMVSYADAEVLQASPATALIRERTIHFAGQPVALVTAGTLQAAREAARAIRVSRTGASGGDGAGAGTRQVICTGHGRTLSGRDASWRRDRGHWLRPISSSDNRYDTAVNNHHPHGTARRGLLVGGRQGRGAHLDPGHLRHPRHDRARLPDAGIGHPGHLAFPRRRLRLQGAAVVAVDVLGDAGLQENRPPGAAGTDARADVHPGRSAPGDGAGSGAGVQRRRSSHRHRTSRARANLDPRRLLRLHRGLFALSVCLPQCHDDAPSGPHQ